MTAFANSRATEKFGKSYKDIDLNVLLVRRNVEEFATMELAQFWAQIFVPRLIHRGTYHNLSE